MPAISRRSMLRASGVGLALPLLAGHPVAAKDQRAFADRSVKAKRFVAIGAYLGFHTPDFFPTQTGSGYAQSKTLKPIDDLRNDFTVFSGLDHRAPNGHKCWMNYLTGFGSPSVSIDQVVAQEIGGKTRFASLELTCGRAPAGGQMNFTREGVLLPMIGRPSVLFGKLFSSDTDKARMGYVLSSGRSVLDSMLEEAKSLQRKVSVDDRRKLEEYFSSLRDVETRVAKQREWLKKPTPSVKYKLPDIDPIAPDRMIECETLVFDLMALALQTDSTRVLSFLIPGEGQVFTINGQRLSAGYHGLSHHGNDPSKVADFNRIGREHIRCFGHFLRKLKNTSDSDGRPLLDTTAVLFGTGMGNANTHNNSHLPIVVAGAGYKSHGKHIAIDRSSKRAERKAPLLGDLYVSMLQSLGCERDRFANASSNMNEYLM